MLFEHLIYSISIAIIAGMIHLRRTGRDYSWIIIAIALAGTLLAITIPVFSYYQVDENLKDEVRFGNLVDGWTFTQIASWGKTLNAVGGAPKVRSVEFDFNRKRARQTSLPAFSRGTNDLIQKQIAFKTPDEVKLNAGTAASPSPTPAPLSTRIAAPASSTTVGSNLIANPGFENGSTSPLNWTLVTSNGNTPSWDTVFHTGTRSLRISISGTIDKESGYPKSDLMEARPLATYTFSAWVKTQNTGGTNNPGVRVVESDANNRWLRSTTLMFSKGTNDWTQRQTTFKTGSDTVYLYIYAFIWNGYGTMWLDDMEIYEEGTDQNIISNDSIPSGGSEKGVENNVEAGSFNIYGPVILIFMAVISLLLLRKYIMGKKFYKDDNKAEIKVENEKPGIEKKYHIFAIASGKGGVGKTTIAANLGIMLSKLHKKVTIIDMDLAMPNLEIITGLKSTPVGLIDVLEGRLGLDRVTYAGPEGIKIIPPGVMLEGYSKEETKRKITELLRNLPVDNDYIILDMPPGREAIDVLSGNDIGVLLVVNSNKPSILDAVNIKVILEKKDVKILGVILNRYYREPELIDEIEKILDSKVVAVIPESKLVNDAYMYEECFVVAKAGSAPAKELMDLAKEITGTG